MKLESKEIEAVIAKLQQKLCSCGNRRYVVRLGGDRVCIQCPIDHIFSKATYRLEELERMVNDDARI